MLTPDQQKQLAGLLQSANNNQKIWLAGYLTGVVDSTALLQQAPTSGVIEASPEVASLPARGVQEIPLSILFGSHSGNSELIANQLLDTFQARGLTVKLHDLNDYKARNIKKEENILLIISTHGEGEPPIAAEEFYQFIHSDRAPKLDHLSFAVLALGDSSYQHYCKTGADLDARFEALGAKRIADRVDADLDFEEPAEAWINKVVDHFAGVLAPNTMVHVTTPATGVTSASTTAFSKKNPFQAIVLDKVLLSGRGSAKENYHIELSLEDSGMEYEPGDALGIIPKNSPALVEQLLKVKSFNPGTVVQNGFGNKSLEEALADHYELSVLTKDVVNNYANVSKNADLQKLVQDEQSLFNYLYGRDVIDLLEDFPGDIAPEELIQVLRKLPPRLYSIASSPQANPEEVHLTIGAVRYANKGRHRNGVCSGFVADRIELDDTLPVYIDKNKNFRLPEDDSKPIIMVGPGTGVAPFRAFLQQREVQRATGKNWLFFGDQHFTTDFLYQTEIQKWHEKGVLNKIDLAFSRDTSEKVYVQHRMLEKSKELFGWLEEGAHFYVCGDSKHMAPDVNKALIDIVAQNNGGNQSAAEAYVHDLKKARRYVEDVY